MTSKQPRPLLNQRAAMIFLLGALCAAGAGILTVVAGAALATGALTAGGTFAGAVVFFHSIIE
ncbi:hypothetical protein [Kitasatospora phosalacinea]|uniref:Uncharacterized protein n=1 Tax=Kitasatospora phosalacinea TaxID=2065 RepID=A0A9W6PKN8_9ACTN|nr:hypothetical protein [Kitasatospora phosalacinea]GLW56811.1 hypothetical protein Kpho01_48220 [Kitasatospora phosalacinea]